jgi:hypothetical protein
MGTRRGGEYNAALHLAHVKHSIGGLNCILESQCSHRFRQLDHTPGDGPMPVRCITSALGGRLTWKAAAPRAIGAHLRTALSASLPPLKRVSVRSGDADLDRRATCAAGFGRAACRTSTLSVLQLPNRAGCSPTPSCDLLFPAPVSSLCASSSLSLPLSTADAECPCTLTSACMRW